MAIYFTSDTHFWHKKILSYANRPFNNVEEMNEKLISNWNSIVSRSDTVYHLGDFCFSNLEQTKIICSRLNGRKILMKGNHDTAHSNTFWRKVGFSEIYNAPFVLYNFEIAHRPKFNTRQTFNIHGHTHYTDQRLEGFNVGVDANGFKPILLETIYYSENYNKWHRETQQCAFSIR